VTTDTRPAIERLLRPRAIAIVGISPQPKSPTIIWSRAASQRISSSKGTTGQL